jgi:choline-glycine betaine transporter
MEQTNDRLTTMQELARAKSPLAKAILDDEASRQQSERGARTYLTKKWAHEDKVPYWAWAIGWSAFGVLLCLSVLTSGPTILDMIKGVMP